MDEKELEKTFGLLDRIDRAQGDPWLYERVMARVRKESEASSVYTDRWVGALVAGLFAASAVVIWLERDPGVFQSPARAFVDQYSPATPSADLLQTPFFK